MIASGLLTIQRPLNKLTLISGPVRTFDFVSLTTYPANVRVCAWISHQVFFVQFSPVISRLETTWTWRVSLCFVNLGTVLKNSSPEKFLFTWQIKRRGIVAIKFIATRIDFPVALSLCNLSSITWFEWLNYEMEWSNRKQSWRSLTMTRTQTSLVICWRSRDWLGGKLLS